MTDDEIHHLATYTPSDPVALAPEDVEFLVEQLAGRIDVSRTLDGKAFRINPGKFAGVVRLPSGTLLRSSPRIPTDNIFRMLAFANDLPVTLPEITGLGELDHMLEFVADYFASMVEGLVEQGLYRAYVETEENLAV